LAEKDLYKILQVDPEADPDVITAAFRVLARRLHPDLDITGVQQFRMSELNRAYGVLRDPTKRSDYDRQLAAGRLTAVGPGNAAVQTSQGVGSVTADRWASRKVSDEAAQMTLSFGRYSGMTLKQIARQDPDYLRWLSRHSSGIRYRNAIEAVLPESRRDPYAPTSR
jgi:DnaJ-class molecular chaperone